MWGGFYSQVSFVRFFCGSTLVVCLSNCVLWFFLDRMPLALFFFSFPKFRWWACCTRYTDIYVRRLKASGTCWTIPSPINDFFPGAYLVFLWFWPAWYFFWRFLHVVFHDSKCAAVSFFLPFQESKTISLFGNCNPKLLKHLSFSFSHQPLRSVYFLINVCVLKFWSVHCVFDDSLRILVAFFLFWEEPTPLFLSVLSCLPCAKEHVHDTFACSQETN